MYDLAESHPTPQFARASWHDLTGIWQFAFDPDDIGQDAHWECDRQVFDRTITVPFPPESDASGIGDPEPHHVVWYRREIDLPALERDAGQRLMLHCGAVDYRADVWVNGVHAGHHEGGQTPFAFDITPMLAAKQDQVTIVIRAEDDPFDLGQPRGKQDWNTPSHGIWYRRTTGIWQPVWLEVVGRHAIAGIHWQTDAASLALDATVTIDPPPRHPLTLHTTLTLHDEAVANETATVSATAVTRHWQVGEPGDPDAIRALLWSPAYPNLVEAVFTLRDGDTVLDEVHSYAGIRTVGTDASRFLLNGRPTGLRMVLEQGFWPASHLAPPSPTAIRREVELIRELGFNAARIHQKVADPRLLAWCDRLGLLVWGEMANAFTWNDRAMDRVTREWPDVVRRDRNHPAIVAWVPINESWGVPALTSSAQQRHWQEALWHLTHALDGSRPVISNDGWEQTRSDLRTIHDYSDDPEVLRARYGTADALAATLADGRPAGRMLQLDPECNAGTPVMITEYGGISYAPRGNERWYGYGTVDTEAEYLATVAGLTAAIREAPGIAGFCYTQLTDTGQETNGLLTEDREPKLPIDQLRRIFGD